VPRDRRPHSLVPRTLALLPLALLACVLPTSLGELPSTTAVSETSEIPVVTSDTGIAETSAPPSMTSDTGIAEPPPPHAWAMSYEQWRTSETGSDTDGTGGTGGTDGTSMSGTSGASGDGGPVISPDTLVVQISTGPDDCDDPHAPLECGGGWTFTMLIPSELQVPGTYDLIDVSAIATISGEDDGPACSFGAGMVEGTVELLELSDPQVTGRVSMVEPFGFEPNGDFVAIRCI